MATPAPDAIKRLGDRFDQDRNVFLSTDDKEEQLPQNVSVCCQRGAAMLYQGGDDDYH